MGTFVRNQSSQTGPIRTCVVCRKTAEKKALVRFVAHRPPAQNIRGGGLEMQVDVSGSALGRGVYCHATVGCLGHKKVLGLLRSSFVRGSSRSRSKVTTESEENRASEDKRQVTTSAVGGGLEAMIVLLRNAIAGESRREGDQVQRAILSKVIQEFEKPLRGPATSLRSREGGGNLSTVPGKVHKPGAGRGKLRF